MMYKQILVALDGTDWSDMAMHAAVQIAENIEHVTLIGCHVYGAQMHRKRFTQMEPGLPGKYQEEKELTRLRGSHEDLITDGMQIISDAYLAPLQQLANEKKIKFEDATPEGRNYFEILKVAREKGVDLVIVGAHGHGFVPEAILGSTSERVLSHSWHSDVLVMKRPWNLRKKPILVGIDGSQNSYAALLKSADLAQITGSGIHAVAVYDPYLHSGVFTNIAGVLPKEKQAKFNFTAQEQLHDEIIDDGLEQLYQANLEQGIKLVDSMDVKIHSEVLSGKVFPQIHHYASRIDAGLIVMGRWGLHKENSILIGSNTHNLTRICTTNILVVNEAPEEIRLPAIEEEKPLDWSEAALKILERIPEFVRPMARRSIEKQARERGLNIVDEPLVKSISEKMGMKKG